MRIRKYYNKYNISGVSKEELLELCNGIRCADNESLTCRERVFKRLMAEFEKYIEYGEIIPTE